ncbi:hypothetical protein ADK35_38020 [Streptomyces viridochromogenes]|nr:hypothetical protein ADK35_38020 [Streptomyces viridochromogenes]KOG10541.1 hypothetical protein ADK36_38820 [Streptomyces viridochromogenes]
MPPTAREVAWLQAEERREAIPASRAGGRELPGLVLGIDATPVTWVVGHQLPDLGFQRAQSGFAGQQFVGEFADEAGGAPFTGHDGMLGLR